MRSGEYATEKSLFTTRPDVFSSIGIHISSVVPGYTVDSKITIFSLERIFPTALQASSKYVKSGRFSLSTGVGTATINILQQVRLFQSFVI